MYEKKPERKLTPEEVKIITFLAQMTPKTTEKGRRLALPYDPIEAE